MTPRSIRRAQERKTRKELERKAPQADERQTPNTLAPQPTLSQAVSEAQLQANRANSQLSCGPKSSQGKAKSSVNAVKTGLTGRTILLPSDDAAAYEHHLQSFAADHSPVGSHETDLVQSLADTWWRLQRIPVLEAALYALGNHEFTSAFEEHEAAVRPSLIQAQTFLKYEKQFRNLQLQEARLYRRYEKDRAELRQLQQARRQQKLAALHLAAIRYQTATETNQPYTPAQNGVEFSIAEIEQHLADLPARDTARPGYKQSAQAA
jgi:hypothetical protein